MPNQEIIERFRNHGIDIDQYIAKSRVPERLSNTDPETLWLVLEDFSDGAPIGMQSPNEKAHQLTLSYALYDAYENDRLSITQDDVDRAAERAASTMERNVRGSSTKADVATEEPSTTEGTTAKKGTRDPGLKPMVFTLVEDNPKAQANEIVDMVHERKPQAKDATIKVYYSQARTSLGLPSIGKKGRKGGGLYPKLKKLVEDNPEASKEEIGDMLGEVNPNTLNVYYGKARTELGL